MGRGRTFSVQVNTEVDTYVDISPSDFSSDMVREWVEEYATEDEIEYAIGNRLINSKTLEQAFAWGKLSLFDVVDFLKSHKNEIDLHLMLFGDK